MDIADAEGAYNVKLSVFEGPLDLLLHLIRQDKIDIYDIPISRITGQYLEYLDLMRELNLEIASEFLVMAATLIYIKSRMLLPPDETIPVEEQEDPRAGLVERLLEYQAFKEASLKLREREDLWINAFSRPTEPDDGSLFEPELHLFEMNIFDLMEALKKIFSKIPSETLKITKEKLTMQDRISFILDRMEKESTLRFNELFEGQSTRMQVIVTFLALLEILKLRLARAYQNREFGTIWIVHHSSENEDMTKDAEGIIAEQA